MCERCTHSAHIGLCGAFVTKQGVEDMCGCFVATAASLSGHELRVRDVTQQADTREAQQREWDALTPPQQARIRRRVKYRRL